jgi:hypothetical protein
MGTISDKLNAVISAKAAIKAAISAKNVSMSDNPPLSGYAQRISDIESGAVVDPIRRIAAFGTAGAFTWTVPAGVYNVIIESIGGGGGGGQGGKSGHFTSASTSYKGGSGGGSGQGGSQCMFSLDVQPGDIISGTIGTGGAGALAQTGLSTTSGSAQTRNGNSGSSGTSTTIYLKGVLAATIPGGSYGFYGLGYYGTSNEALVPGGLGGSSSSTPTINIARVIYYVVKGAYGTAGGTGVDNDGMGVGGGIYSLTNSSSALPSTSYKAYNGLYIPTLNAWRGSGGMGTSGFQTHATMIAGEAGQSGAVVIFY